MRDLSAESDLGIVIYEMLIVARLVVIWCAIEIPKRLFVLTFLKGRKKFHIELCDTTIGRGSMSLRYHTPAVEQDVKVLIVVILLMAAIGCHFHGMFALSN